MAAQFSISSLQDGRIPGQWLDSDVGLRLSFPVNTVASTHLESRLTAHSWPDGIAYKSLLEPQFCVSFLHEAHAVVAAYL